MIAIRRDRLALRGWAGRMQCGRGRVGRQTRGLCWQIGMDPEGDQPRLHKDKGGVRAETAGVVARPDPE